VSCNWENRGLKLSRVIVVQRYVPSYRVPLFGALAEQLGVHGVELVVAHGEAHGAQYARNDSQYARNDSQYARNDSAVNERWSRRVKEITVSLPRGLIPTWKRVGSLSRDADCVVAELASTSLNTWDFLARRPTSTILWGHGKSYVKAPGVLDTFIERWMARRAAHVMTYTEAGRSHLLDGGVDPARVTSIGNSTDTVALRRLRNETRGSAESWREMLHSDGPVALFVGGLDRDKRIPLLIDAARAAWNLDPSFRLIVAGSGQDGHLVESVEHEPWLLALRSLSPRDMAALSHVSSAIWMPGRVGLVAVDALALGLPVLTTRFPFHAPELDYLVEGESVHFLPDAADSFAAEGLAIMRRPASQPTANGQEIPSAEAVAARMAAVICGVMRG
jgi:glycosyltransferase involved in cell wall biosynthesis